MRRADILGAALVALAVPAFCHAQAVDLTGTAELAASVTADRPSYALDERVVLTVSVRNLADRPRYVGRGLIDARRLRIAGPAGEFRLESRSGREPSVILDRLDPHGQPKDRLAQAYALPECCIVLGQSGRLDRLPSGTYTIEYVAAASEPEGAGDAERIRAEPITLTIGAARAPAQ